MRYGRRPKAKRGLTLIEVLAATALLTALMATFIRVGQQLRDQRTRASQIAKCSDEVEQMLSQWFVAEEGLPRAGTGVLTSDSSLTWNLTVVPDPEAEELGLVLIRMEIRRKGHLPHERPLMTLDMVDADEGIMKEAGTSP